MNGRKRKLSAGLLLVLILIIVGVCLLWEPLYFRALKDEQIRLLAQRILENTPEHIHWAKGTTFSWVFLSLEKKIPPARIVDEVTRQLKQRYGAVYTRREDIPADHLEKQLGEPYGYRGGFLFSFVVEAEVGGRVKIEYSDWQGPLAASWHSETYRWVKGSWAVVAVSPGPVA